MHDIHITPNDSLRSVQSGPIRSYSVYSVLFYPFWSIWSYLVLFGPIRSSLLLFGPFGHVQSATIFFSPFCHPQSLLGSVGPYSNVLSYLVHSVLFGLYSVLFSLIWFFSIHQVLSSSVLFGPVWSCQVLFSLIQSFSVLFGPFGHVCSCLVNSVLFVLFGPSRSIPTILSF